MRRTRAVVAGAVALAMGSLALPASLMTPAMAAPVGQGFTVTPSDLAFILKQIKIAERHAATLTPANPCGTLVGPGPDQVPDRLTTYGLRTVDGSCNNLFPGRETLAAADQPFPRLTDPDFRPAEDVPAGFGPPGPTSYAQKTGSVFDSHPRTVSNLIVDQTSTNPAAVAAAAFPVRTQGNTGIFPCTTDPDPTTVPETVGDPPGCVPSHQTLDIPNVTTDVGLSPPYNSWFTFFGQFFDHGVDQTVKSGASVFVPLHDDDPLVTLGPDGRAGTGDEVPPSRRFMVLTRAQNQPGADGVLGTADDVQDANNTDSPWVDQSQTYTSHSSHQVFLREYDLVGGVPVPTGKLLGGLPGPQASGMATWASVKEQARTELGLLLADTDATNVPMLAADPYGNFIAGANGLPQYVTATGLVEGNLASPVPVPADVRHFDTPFLTDIAHNADPSPQDTDHNPATPPVAPTPDEDSVASADFGSQPPGTYDDEMLDAHFCAGDGRVNENIALTTVHQVFHSEHDRLVDDVKNVLSNDTSTTGVAALAQWRQATGAAGWNGSRLFQAARFITEMEYQHLVFEEFGRKVQPGIRLFHVYSPDINPAVQAEFAHAVYRFGHSMLDDEVIRKNADGSDNSLPLLTAFLNPPEYFNNKGSALTPEAAAGSVVMGSVDQVGNELDEFVTETLRNNLLGLPLDLPTLNMTRAREAGVPRLNDVRRQIFAKTNDGQLQPYTSWADFGQNIKHPESLVNFVAAYGTHPSITSANTLAGKRAAAKAIVDPSAAPAVDPTLIPADASDFLFSSGPWAGRPSGLDDVDLWVGGLAEITNLFGGLLGSTFNYVFQTQMESLQDGDRFYYLARTPGMNLRTQLEGNSFAELIQRNTTGTSSLKADVFATADCKFQLANLQGTAAGYAANGATVADDPTTECDETLLLLRKPDGTIQYKQVNTVDPPGINGQSVYNGTPGVDRVWGGNDNDTFWGDDGNDVIQGNGGDDVSLGGEGNDVITDLSGADVLKGGPGHDAMDGGIGDDIFMGGDGQDVVNGGANDNETFGGPGNDFVIAGQGADAVFGDGGDDWIQGGSGQDLLIGDHGAPFFDDPAQAAPGNDVFVGQVGENDYDAEGGDDIMAQNAAVDRNAGSGGFDWAIHQYNTVPADDDMTVNNNLVGLPLPVVVNRDRWQETEGNSGSTFNDVIKGDEDVPSAVAGGGFTGCNVLDQAGLDRIPGLAPLLPPLTGDPAPVVAASAAGYCPTEGPIWGDGNILLGGAGSDEITGRGADDIIDGDKALTVRISVRTNPADPATEIGSTDLIEGTAKTGTFGPGTTGMTLQQAVFAGLVNPGSLVATRTIATQSTAPADCAAAAPVNCDTAVFQGPRSDYTITPAAAAGTTLASLQVTQVGAPVAPQRISDGTDTLRGIERLRFSDQTLLVLTPGQPTGVTATAGNASATVGFTPAAPNGGPAVTSFLVQPVDPTTGAPVGAARTAAATATSLFVTGLTNGTPVAFTVSAVNAFGPGTRSAASNTVTPAASTGPTVTSQSPANGATGIAVTRTITASFSENVVGVSTGTNSTNVVLRNSAGVRIPANVTYTQVVGSRILSIDPTSNLTDATTFTVTVTGGSAPGTGLRSATTGIPVVTSSWSFTTVNLAPTVTARTPAAGATGVAVTVSPTATFSEPVVGVSATTAVLRRINANGTTTLVPSVVTYNATTRVVTINPSANLQSARRYRVTLTGGATAIREAAGTALPLTTVSWTFTTA